LLGANTHALQASPAQAKVKHSSIAATISVGGDWPCGEGNAPQGSVLILSAEDGAADTIVPRLIAAGPILVAFTS
jgi:putative DNA primase/helicase